MASKAIPGACPFCGNPFTLPAGTLTMLNAAAVLQCNRSKCASVFTIVKLPGGTDPFYLAPGGAKLPTWTGPPLYPDLVVPTDPA